MALFLGAAQVMVGHVYRLIDSPLRLQVQERWMAAAAMGLSSSGRLGRDLGRFAVSEPPFQYRVAPRCSVARQHFPVCWKKLASLLH